MATIQCLVSIDHTEIKTESGKEFVTYVINVKFENNKWQVTRRFSEFHDLKIALMQIPPKYNFPDFPSKKAFFSTSHEVTEQRRLKFSRFLNLIVQQPLYFSTPEVKKFLSFPEQIEDPAIRPPSLFATKLKDEKRPTPPLENPNQPEIKIVKIDNPEAPRVPKSNKVLPLIPGSVDTTTSPSPDTSPNESTTTEVVSPISSPVSPTPSASPTSPESPSPSIDSEQLLKSKLKEETKPKRTSYVLINADTMDDNELKQKLLKGEVFLKYSKSGQPHNRFVHVTEDFKEIVWRDPKKNIPDGNIKKDFKIQVDSIGEVHSGQKTQTFLKSGRAFRTAFCFSIITSDRTLDLECKTSSERDMWVKAFKLICKK